MRIIGIDPGLNVTGYGIVEIAGEECRHLHHGVIRTRTTQGKAERLTAIRDGVREAVLHWHADAAAVESSFVGNNARSAMALGEARAAAIIGLADGGLAAAEYAPALVKQTVAGYGRGEKAQVGEMVRLQLGLATLPTPADAADALAIAITHWAHARISMLAIDG
jgi:crossover junction endodeoxyribonuclease RuvC